MNQQYLEENRVLGDRGWEFYNGYNVAFQPKQMSPRELLTAHRALWRETFSLRYSIKRILRACFILRWGAFLMCAVMNSFYCIKALTGNLPRDYAEFSRKHPRDRTATGPRSQQSRSRERVQVIRTRA